MKIKIFVTIILFLNLVLILGNYAYATKEALMTPKEEGSLFGGGFSAAQIKESCEYMDADKDGHISVEELQEKIDSGEDIDKHLTVLRVFSNDSLNKAEDAYLNYLNKVEGDKVVKNVELAELLREEHNKRRAEEGLSAISDSHIDDIMNISKYYPPDKSDNGSTSGADIDGAISDAKDFLNKADDEIATITTDNLQKFSNSFYNIFLTIGTALAVIIGIVIGIKYMTGSIEAKADIKQMLVPYIVGCIVVFGSFGIWKMVLEIMEGI